MIGVIEVRRHEPARTALVEDDLAQRDEADLGIAGGNELERLRDAVALDDLAFERAVDAERLHRLDSSRSVGRDRRVGESDLGELAVLQRRFAERQSIGLRIRAPACRLRT